MKGNKENEVSGYLLLNKKSGITSFGALNEVKKAFSTGKVGHTGTLDKFATGLLVVLVGRAVKLATWLSDCDKRYEAVVRFGFETDTLDPEGKSVAEAEIPSLEELRKALPEFRGDILQAPPEYSAVHIQGERASDLARQGKIVEMKKRPVSIYELELLSYNPPDAVISVHCSKGTYIRSLARDIALKAGSRAHVAELKRTHIAGFSLDCASPAEPHYLQPLSADTFEKAGIMSFTVSNETAAQVIHGRPLAQVTEIMEMTEKKVNQAALFSVEEKFLGVIEKKGNYWQYGYVYAGA